MGSKYVSQAVSSFDASPPPDDGSVQASNKVTWAFVKTKLASPVLTLAQAINSALVTFTNFGSRAVTATDSVAAADHMKTIEAAGTFTESLPDATATGAGFVVSVRAISGTTTIALTTATDTLNGTVNGTLTLQAGWSAIFKTNAAATGYNTISVSPFVVSANGGMTVSTINSGQTLQSIANAGTYDILNVGTATAYLVSVATSTAGQDVSLVAIVSCTSGPTVRINNLFASAGLALSNPSAVICRITNTTGVTQNLMISYTRIYN